MNIKKFLVCKISPKLNSDVHCIIWNFVEESSADLIKKRYNYKVAINADCFLLLIHIINHEPDYSYVNRVIDHYMRKVTYKYIQSTGTWIDYLHDLLVMYGKCKFFHINNVNYMINHAVENDVIYENTNIRWWEYT